MSSQEKLSMVLKSLKNEQGIALGEQLTLGNVCKSIYRGEMSGEKVVIKIGITESEQEEIRRNILGYQEMKMIGAQAVIPQSLQRITVLDLPVIIMEDCGLDFWHAVQQSHNPASLYERLAQELLSLYNATKSSAEKAVVSLESIRERLVRQYDQCLFHSFLHDGTDELLVDRFRREDLGKYLPKHSCFASFDFTPEDVFVSSSGLRYADPLPNLLGIPVIDLACFAGVARDAYHLPGSKFGYVVLRKLALQEVPRIIGLGFEECSHLFFLGKALQCSLSSRFRIEKDFLMAEKFYCKSKFFLRKFLN